MRVSIPDDPAQMMARTIMDGGWRTHVMRALGHDDGDEY